MSNPLQAGPDKAKGWQPPARGFQPGNYVPILVALGVLFFGLAQICQTGWMLFPLGILAGGSALAWQGTPTIFLFSLPVFLLLDRSGIGPEEWLSSLLEGGNPFFLRRGVGGGPDLDTSNLMSLAEWLVAAGGTIAAHALACRYIALRKPPFQTGQLVPVKEQVDSAWWGMKLPFTIVLTVLCVMVGWVMTSAFLEDGQFPPRVVQLIRWVLVVGGGLVLGLFARIILGLAEGRAMDPAAAAGFLAHSSWAEMGREINKTDRWLMWWRLGRRRKAEARWRRLLLGVKPSPAAPVQPARHPNEKGNKG